METSEGKHLVEQVSVLLEPMNITVEDQKGTILLRILRDAEVGIETICGGRGDCGKCKVILVNGEAEDISPKWQKYLSPQQFSEGYRLACQVRVMSDCVFRIPVESRILMPKILFSFPTTLRSIDPASKKYLARRVELNDCRRLPVSAPIEILDYSGPIPQMTEETSNKIQALAEDAFMTFALSETNGHPAIVSIELGDKTSSNYGLAIDIGTTTIAVALVNLNDGRILGTESGLNKQMTYGEELVTRIGFSQESEGLRELQDAVLKTVNDLVDQLSLDVGISITDLTDVTVGANTVMNHLLTGMDVTYLNEANSKVSRKPIIRKSGELGLHANMNAYVYCLPNVSRFLGGDVVGGIVASGMTESDDLSLLIDMGTNGEIVFGNRDWLVSCSCASGPAWEGEGIRFGMRGMDGAIEHVKIDPSTLKTSFTVIGDSLPKGICGSGIIDVAAEMFSSGLLDFTGKIVKKDTDLVRMGREGLEYVIATRDKTGIDRDIVVTQRDMSYIIDSKAAVCGAIIVLMEKYNLAIHDVGNFHLAGAFGAFTDIKNATTLGVFPEFPNSRVNPLGDGSLA
ncbi:ASKHA domain-containing protein, partial [Candidatus Bathyarchaeota archaeon]|nr:ASKHA domain-containing protein [Candidatus Bathyarchaeota archaeon]